MFVCPWRRDFCTLKDSNSEERYNYVDQSVFLLPSHVPNAIFTSTGSVKKGRDTYIHMYIIRLVNRGTSVRICFGSPFSSKVVVCGHCLVTLSLTFYETLKWLSSLPTVMQKSFWWWECSDRYITSLSPHLHTLFSLYLISLYGFYGR